MREKAGGKYSFKNDEPVANEELAVSTSFSLPVHLRRKIYKISVRLGLPYSRIIRRFVEVGMKAIESGESFNWESDTVDGLEMLIWRNGANAAAQAAFRPCALACPKCDNADIARRWREVGKYPERPTASIPSTEFVDRAMWDSITVKKECIIHHCRECQYEWDTSPKL